MFQVNTPIKNRHFSDSDKAREIWKTVQSSYMNPILYVTSFMIPNGYYDGQMQWQTFTWLFSKQYFFEFFTFVHDFLNPISISHQISYTTMTIWSSWALYILILVADLQPMLLEYVLAHSFSQKWGVCFIFENKIKHHLAIIKLITYKIGFIYSRSRLEIPTRGNPYLEK